MAKKTKKLSQVDQRQIRRFVSVEGEPQTFIVIPKTPAKIKAKG